MSGGWLCQGLQRIKGLLQKSFLLHFLTGVLKSYLRELPEPLMTFELYNEWFKAAG